MQIEMLWKCGVSTCAHTNRGRDMVCQGCGKPKTDEEYLMPEDIENAPEITDPTLLKKALAGPNWRCRYCDSEQRRVDGLCQQCGSNQTDSKDRRPKPPPPDSSLTYNDPYRSIGQVPYYPEESVEDPVEEPAAVSSTFLPKQPLTRRQKSAYAVGVILTCILSLGLYAFWPRTVHTAVASVSWSHTVSVEKYKMFHESGFSESEPLNAVNIQSAGLRYHHSDHVLDHYNNVPYIEQVPCGQTCVQIPRTCTTSPKTCTSNKNGFASCTGGGTTCTGGGQSCSTKYCSEPRHRQEPVYIDVPQYRPYYTWDVWRWAPERKTTVSGTSLQTRWPNTQELNLGQSCSIGEQEREGGRDTFYAVVFSNENIIYHPKSTSEFTRFEPQSKWAVEVDRAGIVHNVTKE